MKKLISVLLILQTMLVFAQSKKPVCKLSSPDSRNTFTIKLAGNGGFVAVF